MNAIKAVVRHGRIETEEPLDLPDGTELLIPRPSVSDDKEGWDNSPAGIAAWLQWYDTLEPLILNETDEAKANEWRKRCDQHEMAQQKDDLCAAQ